MPEMCIDPITPAAYIHLGLQELISREIAGTEEAVLTTGSFQAGATSNVIPQTAELKANMRTFDDDLHDRLFKRIEEISTSIAAAYRATATVETIEDDPMLQCDKQLSELASAAVKAGMPQAQVLDGRLHLMGSEDFSYIARELPSTYFALGAKVTDTDEIYGQHHPKVRFSDDALPIGAATYAAVAMAWLESQAE